jgi:hypothetical protein
MHEVLPNVDRGVLRGYLTRHGDQMTAITRVPAQILYLEFELMMQGIL